MSDTTQILQLPGAQLESIERSGNDSLTLHFSLVHLVQEMDGAFENSLWTQAAKLTIEGIHLSGELPDCPCEISSGDLADNIFTYRDHAPLPINWRGTTSCTLTVAGKQETFAIEGTGMQLEQIGFPCYIKHISK